jgi:hypothetical protein
LNQAAWMCKSCALAKNPDVLCTTARQLCRWQARDHHAAQALLAVQQTAAVLLLCKSRGNHKTKHPQQHQKLLWQALAKTLKGAHANLNTAVHSNATAGCLIAEGSSALLFHTDKALPRATERAQLCTARQHVARRQKPARNAQQLRSMRNAVARRLAIHVPAIGFDTS